MGPMPMAAHGPPQSLSRQPRPSFPHSSRQPTNVRGFMHGEAAVADRSHGSSSSSKQDGSGWHGVPSPSHATTAGGRGSPSPRQQRYNAACQEIKACQSWFELRDVIERCGGELDHLQVTSILSGLAKTAPSPGTAPRDELREYHQLVGRVLQAASTRHVSRLRPREISTILWAAAKAGMPPESWPAWLPPLLSAANVQLPRDAFNPQDLSMTLWALATLAEGAEGGAGAQQHVRGGGNEEQPFGGTRPRGGGGGGTLRLPDGLLDAALHAAEGRMPAFGAQALSNALWALARLGRRPQDGWLRAALARMVHVMPSATPQALCNSAWALVVLEAEPGAEWREAFLRHSGLALEFAQPKVLAQLAWSTARLRLNPSQAWLGSVAQLAASFQWAPRVSSTPSSSPASGWPSGPQKSQRRWPMQRQSTTASPQDLSNVMWALAVQRFRPRAQHMEALVAACVQCLPRFEPNELCCVIWSVAKLGYTPAPDAWQQLLAAAARLAPKCSAQGLCNVVWAAATLKTTPQQQWMQEMLCNLIPKLEDCGPQELANLWWALGSMRWRLGPGVRDELAGELRVNLHEFNAGETAMVMWALARLGLQPQPEVLQRQLEMLSFSLAAASSGTPTTTTTSGSDGSQLHVSTASADGSSPRTVAAVLWAVSEMQRVAHDGRGMLTPRHRAALDRLLLSCLAARPQPASSPAVPQETRQRQQGAPVALLPPPPPVPSAARLPPPWSPRELALCFHSLGCLRQVPPSAWLRAALDLLRAHCRDGRVRKEAAHGGVADLRQLQQEPGVFEPGVSREGPLRVPQQQAHADVQGSQQDAGGGSSVSVRDAAMIAHGLSGILREMTRDRRPVLQLLLAGRLRFGGHRSAVAAPRLTGGAELQRSLHGSAPAQMLPLHPAAANYRLYSACVRQLVASAAAGADSAGNRELAMMLGALPALVGSLGERKHRRWLELQRGSGGSPQRRLPLLRACTTDVDVLLATARRRMEAPGRMRPHEAVGVASAAAKLAVEVDRGFAHAVMACFRDANAAGKQPHQNVSVHYESRGPFAKPLAVVPSTPTCRDWVVCLWSVERLLLHSHLLGRATARAWVADACGSIVRLLSRPGRRLASLEAGAAAAAGASQQRIAAAGPVPSAAAQQSGPSRVAPRSWDVPGAVQGCAVAMGQSAAAGPTAPVAFAMQRPFHGTGLLRPVVPSRGAVAALLPNWRQKQLQWQQQQQHVRRLRRQQRQHGADVGMSRLQKQALRRRHVATYEELQAGAAAAARLARSAAIAAAEAAEAAVAAEAPASRDAECATPAANAFDGGPYVRGNTTARTTNCKAVARKLPGGGAAGSQVGAGVAGELSRLAQQLRHASGLMRCVHWRWVCIGKAAAKSKRGRQRRLGGGGLCAR